MNNESVVGSFSRSVWRFDEWLPKKLVWHIKQNMHDSNRPINWYILRPPKDMFFAHNCLSKNTISFSSKEVHLVHLVWLSLKSRQNRQPIPHSLSTRHGEMLGYKKQSCKQIKTGSGACFTLFSHLAIKFGLIFDLNKLTFRVWDIHLNPSIGPWLEAS